MIYISRQDKNVLLKTFMLIDFVQTEVKQECTNIGHKQLLE